MDMRDTLRMLGVPVIDSYMFCDNQSVLTNSTVPQSQLNKRHNALAYQRVREAIAAAVMKSFKIDGKKNPCLLYTSPSPRDRQKSRMPSSA